MLQDVRPLRTLFRSLFSQQSSAILLVLFLMPPDSVMAFQRITRIQPDSSGVPLATVVTDGSMLWTTQYRSSSRPQTIQQQWSECLSQLQTDLVQNQSTLSMIARLNLYADSPETAGELRTLVASTLPQLERPCITVCVTTLPENVQIAVDAVAASEWTGAAVRSTPRVSVMPPGSRIFVSGQAEQNESLAVATRETLASLRRTLQFLGRSDADIVQLRAFVQPMTDSSIVFRTIQEFYPDSVPPVVLVEWTSSTTTPIEIELVAWGGPAAESPRMEFLTPPGFTQSPIYCRVCRVTTPSLIFTGNLATERHSDDQSDLEVQATFDLLNGILTDSQSSMKHLAKATYYVSTNEVSASLNRLRPDYYDPARPPAASKAMVQKTYGHGTLVMDMIAVPAIDEQP